MRIYTRKGDEGRTHVIGGRVDKDDIRVEACGTVDECNAVIGLAVAALSEERDRDLIADLSAIQHELFDAGADLAQVKQAQPYIVKTSMTTRLEERIDVYEQEVSTLRQFILPGGCSGSATLHLARVVARRAERRVVTLAKQAPINHEVRRYLNRLSDLLFVMARVVNARAGKSDVVYVTSREPSDERGDKEVDV